MSKTDDRTVNAQWSSRPDDQRFLSMDDLYRVVSARHAESFQQPVAMDRLQVQPTADGEISVLAPQGTVGVLSNWGFGQLAARAKAPAGYLRSLPSMLAAANLQWSLETNEATDDGEGNNAKILLRDYGSARPTIAALTSATYGRIWDRDVVAAVRDRFDLEVWVVPGASYAATDPKRATTLYASDRDVFIFLVNEGRPIDCGGGDVLRRGFYVSNSETGSGRFHLKTFTYDFVCDNRIIWGQDNVKEISIRHTSGGPMRFSSAVSQLRDYAQSSAVGLIDTVRAAKATRVGKSEKDVHDWLKARGFTLPQSKAAYAAAQSDPRGYDPKSVWGIVQGLTDVAHKTAHTDDRVDLETRAGALLEKLAA